jgi:hypothetical protein
MRTTTTIQGPRISKARALELMASEAGLPSWRGAGGELGRLLGCSRAFVSTWGEFVPDLWAYRLKEVRPAWFEEDAS